MNRRLRRVGQTMVVFALAMTTSLQVASAAQSPGQTQPATPDQTSVAAGNATASREKVPADHTFTLITGDVVALVTGKDGHPTGRVIREAGHPGSIAFATAHDHIYALPRVALPLLAEGRLDRRLFDLTTLQEFHYDDASSPQLPLIGETGQTRALTEAPPAAATRAKTMDSITAEALSVDKSNAGQFWGQVAANDAAPSTLSAGYTKLWLDGVVKGDLDTSVPAIGAPAAWQSGWDGKDVTVAVLDTGIDEKHPDFTGRIKQATSFVSGQSAHDGNGHGTHVASTVAGSGAASGGKYRGVAPGAQLLVGKVMSDRGYGLESDIITGMEWAAAQKARVVSMSLGSCCTDGTDPMSQAVNRLSANNGPLFVIAAGNSGGQMTVGTPAAADSALAVSAVDHRAGWAPAWFTSRGPRYGDYAIKPEISAPGVNITAAKANSNGGYWALSGTSMATPHVAGAAAILAQEHPDWSRDRLYDSLVSSAKQVGGATPSTYGGGVVDVAAATRQPITATAKTDLGTFRPPLPTRATGKVTFRNNTAAPVTVTLTADSTYERVQRARSEKGVTLPAGTASITPSTVSIPANGSVTADVGIALAAIPDGSYYGRVAARDAAGTELAHTIIGWTKGPVVHQLDVRGYDIDGTAPDSRWSYVLASSDSDFYIGVFNGNQVRFYSLWDGSGAGLLPGNYSLLGTFGAHDHDIFIESRQIVLDRDRQLTLDARTAHRIEVDTPHPTVNYSTGVRWSMYTKFVRVSDETSFWPGFEDYVLPAETAPTNYFFELATRRTPAPVEAYVAEGDVRVRPLLPRVPAGMPWPDLLAPPSGRFPLVDAGDGTEAAVAGKDLKGKVALVREPAGTDPPQIAIDKQVAVVTKAGAVGLVFAVNKGGARRFVENFRTTKIWVTVVTAQEGTQLAHAVEDGEATLVTEVHLPYAYLYDLDFPGRMAIDGHYRVTGADVATVINRFHSPEPGAIIEDLGLMDNFWPYVGPLQPVRITEPLVRTDYISSGHQRISLPVVRGPSVGSSWISAVGPLQGGAKITVDRFGPVMTPGPLFGRTMLLAAPWAAYFDYPYPFGGDIWDWFPYPLGAGVQDGLMGGYTARSRVYEGDKLVCDRPAIQDCSILSAGKRRVVIDTSQNGFPFSTRTTTEWTVDIRRPASGMTAPPVIVVQPKPPVDLTNKARSNEHKIPVRVGYQPGANYKSTFRASAWATFDDGATWVQVTTNLPAKPDSEITLPIEVPDKHNGFVGLRINVTDEQGNAVDQTIVRAYGLAIDDTK